MKNDDALYEEVYQNIWDETRDELDGYYSILLREYGIFALEGVERAMLVDWLDARATEMADTLAPREFTHVKAGDDSE